VPWLAPAPLVVAVMIRPTIGPLAIPIGIAWALQTKRDKRAWLIATLVALAAAAPFVIWNAIHVNSPLPLGQYMENSRETASVFSLWPPRVARALAGLLVSPARGIAVFAPIAILGVVRGLRGDRTAKLLAVGILCQLAVMATFHKWNGGLAYGPRMLAEATWVAIFLAAPAKRRLDGALAGLTALVGVLGLVFFDPDQWETRRRPDAHEAAFWDVVDSPLTSLFSEGAPTTDGPLVPPTRCENGELHSIVPK